MAVLCRRSLPAAAAKCAKIRSAFPAPTISGGPDSRSKFRRSYQGKMDPLSGLAVASSVVQLTDFMFKLVSGARCIYRSAAGATAENETLENLSSRLQELLLQIPDLFKAGDHLSKEVVTMADSCRDTAKELLLALAELKRKDKTVWKSFRAALKAVWHQDRINAICTTLSRMQWVLITQLQFAIMQVYLFCRQFDA